MTDILEKLNPEQKDAVLQTDGAVLVLAGAGTGKTRVLTSKIAYLLKTGQAYPNEILAVTFTNKASLEMQERVSNLLMSDIQGMWIGTFHSIANKILRTYSDLVGLTPDYTIIEPDEQQKIIKQIMIDLDIDIKDFPVKSYVNKINEWKDKGISSNNLHMLAVDFQYFPSIKEVYEIYQERCKKLNICDFGDLLLYNVEIFKNNKDILNIYLEKFKYILVDEYQDTNAIQHTWLKLISGVNKKDIVNITCVGDDDQSIYGWRGAEIKNILTFEKDFKNTKIIRLERNYRSTSNILNVASAVIENNKNRHKKTLWTDTKNNGEKVYLSCFNKDQEEVYSISDDIAKFIQTIQYKDIAILVRAGYQTRIFEEVFISRTIPYKIIGGFKFYDRKEIKDCIAYLRLIKNPSDFLAFERIINVPKRGVGSVTIGKILERIKGQKINVLNVCEEMCLTGAIKGKTAENIIQFVELIREFSANISVMDHTQLAKELINASGYVSSLITENSDDSKSAIENINEFIRGLEEFSSLSDFLEYISLVNDKTSNTDDNCVKIMTIHSAKGLEFDTVFLPNWEEGVFPSYKSNEDNIEEERRLAYVAITRAKNRLYISYSKTRYEFGEIKTMKPSRFVKELPRDNLIIIGEELLSNNDDYIYDNNYADDNYYNEERVGKYNNMYQPKNYKKYYDDSDIIISKHTPVKHIDNIAKRVLHPTFGDGVVIKRDGKKLTIAFKSVGVKNIIEDFITYTKD